MKNALRAAAAGVALAVCIGAGCSGCSAPALPTVVSVHTVTNDQCAVIELVLDSGVTKDVCLTASQIEKVIDP